MKIFTTSQKKNKRVRTGVIVLFWLLIWQAVTILIHNSILLAGPIDVGVELWKQLQTFDFYKTILLSLLRITSGFFLGLFVGIVLGMIAYFRPIVEELLSPIYSLLKSIPIASFVVLLLIWIGSKNLAVFVAFLVVFPNVYSHTIAGLRSTDKKLLEVAEVFQMNIWRKLLYLYVPAMLVFLISCIEVSIGMSFKSGVAAEVIGIPEFSFGEKLYMAKIHLNTAGAFAWTIVVILASFLMEKLILHCLNDFKNKTSFNFGGKRRKSKQREKEKESFTQNDESIIEVKNLSKGFGQKQVLNQIGGKIQKGNVYCLMGASGAGKTTFFHILLGIIKQDEGEVKGINPQNIVAVFQEPRLFEEYSTLDNAFLFGQFSESEDWARKELEELLPKDCADKPVKELSVGMQRRVAILRAMNTDAEVVILDEPFAGLDEKTKKETAAYILKRKRNRTLLVSTHSKEDVCLLKGEIIDGNESGFNWNYGGET